MANEGNIMRRHLTEENFRKWDSGDMSSEEMEYFLSHTASCDTCADNWMAFMAQTEPETLLEPPAYLAEEIIARSKQPDLLIAQKVCRTSRQIQLLTYSLKVCTAVALSIMMLFSINLTSMKIASISEPSSITNIQQSDKNQNFIENTTGQKMAEPSDIEPNTKTDKKEHSDITGHLRSGAQNITESLQNFTESIFNFEFNFHFE